MKRLCAHKMICERWPCRQTEGVKDFVRTDREARNWPDKNMPIALCPKHAVGRTEVKEVKMINRKIIVKTAETELVTL